MTFTVTLAADSAAPVTVRVDTADGTSGTPALAPGDYTAISNLVLTFNPGTSRTQQVLVPIVGDTANEPTETFFVNLTNPTGGAAIIDSQGVGTIFDNDAATLFVNIDDPSITEGDTGTKELVFTVSLNQPAGPSGVTVNYSTSNNSATQPSDYLTETGSVTFAPGDTSKPISITINGDFTNEADENFFVNLSALTGADFASGGNQGSGLILNDDTRQLNIDDPSITEGDTGTKELVFTVSLNQPAGPSGVTVNYSTSNNSATQPSDYLTETGSVTFAPGDTSKPISITINGDFTNEADENFFVNLSALTGADFASGGNQGSGLILNDDTRQLNIDDPSITEGDTGTKELVFTVSLNQPAGPSGVTVNYSTSNNSATQPSDYLTETGSVTFAPGDTSKPISITINGDFTNEADENFFVNLSALTGADFATGGNQGSGLILNDDTRLLNIDDPSITEGDSGTKELVFTVSLNQPAGPSGVTVNYSTSNNSATQPSDYLTETGSVTFAPGDTSKPISITINGDFTNEADENFFVNLSALTGADFASGGNQGTGLILNDDTRTLSVNDASVQEGNVPGDDRRLTFTVTLSQAIPEAVTVLVSTADSSALAASDYVAPTNQQVTIPANQTTATFQVEVQEDTSVEPDETFFVNLSSPSANASIGDGQGIGTITNDDGVAVAETDVAVVGGNLVVTDINGGTSNDSLTISLVGANVRVTDPTNTLQAGAGATLVNANTVDVPLASIAGNIQVNTLAGNDSLTIDVSGGNPIPAAGLAYDGGAGNDTLVGPNTANVWNLTGANSGNTTGFFSSFLGVENLTGGSSTDNFVFVTGGSVSGAINGGGGTDALDYSAYYQPSGGQSGSGLHWPGGEPGRRSGSADPQYDGHCHGDDHQLQRADQDVRHRRHRQQPRPGDRQRLPHPPGPVRRQRADHHRLHGPGAPGSRGHRALRLPPLAYRSPPRSWAARPTKPRSWAASPTSISTRLLSQAARSAARSLRMPTST